MNAPDPEQLALAARTFFRDGEVRELRVPKTRRGTLSGYFEDANRFAVEATRIAGVGGAGTYFTLNPVNPDLLARAMNHALEFAQHTTSDADIVSREWFFADADPVRPSGISSTDAEHEAALKRVQQIRTWLLERGCPPAAIVTADSGNGGHVLVRIDLPNDAASTTLIERCLHALDLFFSDDEVKIDTSVGNAARICKLYGTVAAKGDDLPTRPHRISRLLDVPGDLQMAPSEFLERLAALAPVPDQTPRGRSGGKGGQFDLDHWIADHGLAVQRTAPWQGGRKFVLAECAWNHDHTDGAAFIVQFASGAIAAGCHHDGCSGKTWADLRALLEPNKATNSRRDPVSAEPEAGDGTYFTTAKGLFWNKQTKDGPVPTQLTNFSARIVGDLLEDDGVERAHRFEVAAVLHNRDRSFTVPAAEFGAMSWPLDQLGAGAVVEPGIGARDRARAAIQILSGEIPERTTFTHTGWREIDDQWVYLHAGGAIGPFGTVTDSVEVHLTGDLSRYILPSPPEDDERRRAVRASLDVLAVAPDRVSIPVLASAYRAALGDADFSVHLAGGTGTGKSELAALGQQHFGAELDARHLPGSWSSTSNALEALAFQAKDALLVVDDFAPQGSATDVQRAHREADRLLRAQGNHAGRQRMRADTTLRPPKPPRGLILTTGEDVPRGQSLRARMFVVEVEPTDVNWEVLTSCQQAAADGLYAASMSAFLRWLAPRYAEIHKGLRSEIADLRVHAGTSGLHRRTPEIVANLALGFRWFLDFTLDLRAITASEHEDLWGRCWAALTDATLVQDAQQAGNEPATRFIALLKAALASGAAHVAGTDGAVPELPAAWGWRETVLAGGFERSEWRPQGQRVGWIDGGDLYLEPEAAYAAAQMMGRAVDDALMVGARTLHQRLRERGLLATTDQGRERVPVRRQLEGLRRTVLHLRSSLLDDGTAQPAQSAHTGINEAVGDLGGRQTALSNLDTDQSVGTFGTVGPFSATGRAREVLDL